MRHRAAEARAKGLVRGVVQMVLAAEEKNLVLYEGSLDMRDLFRRKTGRKLQVLHLAADMARHAPDAQISEARVDG
ncbi:hypothetical protein D3C71_1097500 [compost metagenome]